MEGTFKSSSEIDQTENSEHSTSKFNQILLNTTYQFKKAKKFSVRATKSAFPERKADGRASPFDDSQIKKLQVPHGKDSTMFDKKGSSGDLSVRANPLNPIKSLFRQAQGKNSVIQTLAHQKAHQPNIQSQPVGLRGIKLSAVK